ncbi:MAG: Uncharacterised protein [Opitutia bacterium UBA7350]|nr:MAG: Uncharacterised protein [Opitutae bacterium UBA7350]
MLESLLDNWIAYTANIEPLKLYGGALVAILFILFLMRLFCGCRPQSVVAYTTEGGKVIVSRSAIVDLVQSACNQIESVKKPRVSIRIKLDIPHLQVRLQLDSNASMRAIEANLQEHLRDALAQNLGIEEIGNIDFIATSFKGGRIANQDPE